MLEVWQYWSWNQIMQNEIIILIKVWVQNVGPISMIFFNKKGCAHGFYFRNAAENIIVTILSLADRVSFSMLSPAEQVIKLVSTK